MGSQNQITALQIPQIIANRGAGYFEIIAELSHGCFFILFDILQYFDFSETAGSDADIRIIDDGSNDLQIIGVITTGDQAVGILPFSFIADLAKDGYVTVNIALNFNGGGSSSIKLTGGALRNSSFEMHLIGPT